MLRCSLPICPYGSVWRYGRSRARSPDGASLAGDPRLPDRRRWRPWMHALPNLAIQLHLVGLVRLGQVSSGDPRTKGGGVELGEGPRVRHMEKRRRIGASREGVPEGRRAGVVLAERRQAEDLLDGAQHGGGRVEGAVDSVTAGIRGGDQQNRAMGVHVVRTILRIVFE